MNNPSIFNRPRNFRMVLKEVYFWTDIIKDWKKLLAHDDYKKLIIDELRTSFSVVCGPQTTSENNHPHLLPVFAVEEKDRKYRIWQRDPLAILMDNKQKCSQKLDYIHTNPLQERWSLAAREEEYAWSSARFYLTDQYNFGFLTHFADRFG